jgi:putative DNA primase/helicase
LEIVAETQTESGTNYGRFLRWKDSKKRVHTWALPVELVHGDSVEFVKRLTSEGLELMPSKKHRERLAHYIVLSKPEATIICTDRIGWQDSGAFVLPNQTFADTTEHEIIYQSAYEGAHKFNVRGTLADWQKNVSKYCVGNSRLAFAVSTAFACPLLPVVDINGGGFNIFGATSIGKSTALQVGGSVWGGKESDPLGFSQSWRTTGNGLESVAETHNHSLLCLDEMSESDARQVGEIAYMLANGHGKTRMSRNITSRRSLTWHLLFLSSGELTLGDKMNEAGQTIRGGQVVRICDIQADTGKHGLFENLHGFGDGQTFADYLRRAAKENYGSAIREFLRWLVESGDLEEIRANWRTFHQSFIKSILKNENYPSEVSRVASRFALVAFAGELASKIGVTLWQTGEAISAAKILFQSWLENRDGKGGSDIEKAIHKVRHFLETSENRFQDTNSAFDVPFRAGFRRLNATTQQPEYLIYSETFRAEICKGFDARLIAHELSARGFLVKGSDGKNTKNERINNKQQRFYVLNSNIFEVEASEESAESAAS